MSSPGRRALQIDDPLDQGQRAREPAQADAPTPAPALANRTLETAGHVGESTGQREEPNSGRPGAIVPPAPSPGRAGQAGREVWRVWSGVTGVGSFRVPHELLVELGDRARELGLPIGLIVTAALAQLLDQPPAQIAQLVDRADDARIHGRRNARRRLSDRTGG